MRQSSAPDVAPRRTPCYQCAVRDTAAGVLLFLPVPLVLWLFTAAPLGPAASVLLGATIMGTHRFYARPFALARAGRRCLMCGGKAEDGPSIEIAEPLGATSWRACSAQHAHALARVFAFAHAFRLPLKVGILGGLALFLPGALLAAGGRLGAFGHADAAALFKLMVGAAVAPFGWLALAFRAETDAPARVPFPVHIQALIGTRSVLWLFRIVGLVWLVQATLHFVQQR